MTMTKKFFFCYKSAIITCIHFFCFSWQRKIYHLQPPSPSLHHDGIGMTVDVCSKIYAVFFFSSVSIKARTFQFNRVWNTAKISAVKHQLLSLVQHSLSIAITQLSSRETMNGNEVVHLIWLNQEVSRFSIKNCFFILLRSLLWLLLFLLIFYTMKLYKLWIWSSSLNHVLS